MWLRSQHLRSLKVRKQLRSMHMHVCERSMTRCEALQTSQGWRPAVQTDIAAAGTTSTQSRCGAARQAGQADIRPGTMQSYERMLMFASLCTCTTAVARSLFERCDGSLQR